jgi:hypothetical protein
MARYIKKFVQHPDERKRYTVDYSEWLDTDETISSVTFEVTPTTDTPLVVDGEEIAADEESVSFFVSAGDDGETYDVLVTATTSAGQVKTLCILFAVRDC